MKRQLTSAVFSLCSLLTFAQFSGTVSDSQGILYTANDDESTCYVSWHEDEYGTTIVIPEVIEGRSVTSIGGSAFDGCNGLTSVTIPSCVTLIGEHAFFGCSGLTSVTVGWDTPLEIEEDVFVCSNYENATLYVPKGLRASYEAANVWKDFDAKEDLFDKTDGVLSDSQGVKYTANDDESTCYVSGHESNYSATIVIPKVYEGRQVTSIGNVAFDGCNGLVSLSIPSSVTSIGSWAFKGCTALAMVTVGWGLPSEIEDVFQESNNQNATLYVPKGARTAYEAANVWKDFGLILELFDKSDGELSDSQGIKYTANNDKSTCHVSGHEDNYSASIVIPEIYEGRLVTSIGDDVFDGCSGLTSVTIPSSVTSIGGCAFSCSSLTSVTIPEGVTLIGGGAFYYCRNLTSVAIPSSVKSIGRRAFDGCSSLTSVTIPEGVKSIGGSAFSGCSGLTSATIPEGVKSIGDCTFKGCSSLTSVTIPEGVTAIGNYAFSGCGLTSVTIPSSVTSIGGFAFSGCSGLTSATIPEGVTSIDDGAFAMCGGLTSIVVEGGNTAYDSRDNCNAIIKTSDNTLIAGCKNTVIPSSVTSIGGSAFNGCSGLTSVTIPEGVTSIGGSAFSGCSGLTSVTIPEGVTSIGGSAFSGCSGLMSVTIPEGVTSIDGSAFSGCSGLMSVTIPEGVTSIDGSAFSGCSGLMSVTIPEGVTSIGGSAFSGCSGLMSVKIPSSVTSIGEYAFSGCSGLMSMIVGCETPLEITESTFELSNISNAILYVPIGKKATYEAADVWKYFGAKEEFFVFNKTDGELSDSQGVMYTANDDESTCYVSGHKSNYSTAIIIPEVFGGRYVTEISDGAFANCSDLRAITVAWRTPLSISSTVFENNSNLTLYVPKGTKASYEAADVWKDFGSIAEIFDTTNGILSDSQGVKYFANNDASTCHVCGHESNYSAAIVIPEVYGGRRITSIGVYAFGNCSGLKSVTIPNSVTSIGQSAFAGCSGLTSVTIPNSVTTIDDWAFSGCSGLTAITIPNSVTTIEEGGFRACSGLTSITIPNSVTSIGQSAFSGCNGLTSIIVETDNPVFDSRNNCNAIIKTATNELIAGCKNTDIPNSVTSIGNCAFHQCSFLTSVTVPNSVTNIGGHAFYQCSGLTSVTIPNSVTSIGQSAFYGCSGLTSVTIPNSVTTIEDWAFSGCSSLTSITIPNSVTSIGRSAFDGCSNLTSITIPNSVTSIGSVAFSDCSSLTSITIPNSVTSIEVGAFAGCGSLTNINVDQDNSTYDSRDNCNAIIETASNMMIAGCQNTVIPNSVTSIGRSAFANCSGLTSVTIPNSVTSIGEYAFGACSGLTTISIPNSVTSIGEYAFGACSGLTTISIPNSVTSIGNGTFHGCSSLTSITIPNSVTSIANNAFRGCSGLTSVIVGWDTPLWLDSFVFGESNNQNVILYVPKGTKAAYEAANVWKGFGTIFECDLPQENVEATDVSAIDNVIYIDPLEVTRGTVVTVPLQMKNTAGVRGFQFDMYLPLGVTVKKDGNNRFICSLNDDRKPSGDQHTLTVNEQADGAIRFLCGSQYDETFTGTEGEILTVQLCVDEKMLAGLYPIILKNVKLTETNINNFYLTETVQTALNVIPYIPGDISGDGVIDVSDYIGVANYILGTPQAGITAAAADVNKDNLVDVSDYIGVANLILYNNIYGQTANASRRWQKRVNTDVSALNNVVYITPFETTSNSETQVSVKMKNTVGIRGFQFDLYLPEGITAKKDGNNRIVCSLNNGRKPSGDQHTLTMSEQPDGAIRFLCGSQYDETFTGNDGEIATLTISVAADVEADNYPIYLRNMKLTETDINNYYTTDEIETSVTVTGPADGRVVLDEASTTAPEAANGVDVRVKRTINANEWSTICLPFAMSATQVKAAFGDDVQLADFTGYVFNETQETIMLNFSTVTAIEANHPYVIKVTSAISEFTVDNVDIAPVEEPMVNKGTSRRPKAIVGTYVANTTIGNGCLFLSNNKFLYSLGTTKMKAFRAYFDFIDLLPDFEENYAETRIQMAFDDETTNVVELKDGRMEELKSCYNLKGQRVEKPLKKGLYIRNGKKVIIK